MHLSNLIARVFNWNEHMNHFSTIERRKMRLIFTRFEIEIESFRLCFGINFNVNQNYVNFLFIYFLRRRFKDSQTQFMFTNKKPKSFSSKFFCVLVFQIFLCRANKYLTHWVLIKRCSLRTFGSAWEGNAHVDRQLIAWN